MSVERLPGLQDTYLVDTFELGNAGHTASYIINGDKTAIVDTGLSPGVTNIFQALDEIGIARSDLDYIILTHVHMDHAGGAGFLAEECENATVVCHESGVEYLSDPQKVERLVESVHQAVGDLAEEYGTLQPIPKDRFVTLSDGDIINLGDRTLETIYAPGHAPHQVCFYDSKCDAMYVADECGEYFDGQLLAQSPPPNFNLKKTLASLERLEEYKPLKLLFPHFGPAENSQELLESYSKIIETWVTDVAEAKKQYGDDDTVVQHFLDSDHAYYELMEDETVAQEHIEMNVYGVLHYLNQHEDDE